MNLSGSFIFGYDFSSKDTGVVIVGKQTKEKMEIVNAFSEEEAMELLKKLAGDGEKKGEKK